MDIVDRLELKKEKQRRKKNKKERKGAGKIIFNIILFIKVNSINLYLLYIYYFNYPEVNILHFF